MPTASDFCASCGLLLSRIVACGGNFNGFVAHVQESIDFYVESAKEDNEAYPKVFDGEYELDFKMDVQSILYCHEKSLQENRCQGFKGIDERQL